MQLRINKENMPKLSTMAIVYASAILLVAVFIVAGIANSFADGDPSARQRYLPDDTVPSGYTVQSGYTVPGGLVLPKDSHE
jgi:hypothetical protein